VFAWYCSALAGQKLEIGPSIAACTALALAVPNDCSRIERASRIVAIPIVTATSGWVSSGP